MTKAEAKKFVNEDPKPEDEVVIPGFRGRGKVFGEAYVNRLLEAARVLAKSK